MFVGREHRKGGNRGLRAGSIVRSGLLLGAIRVKGLIIAAGRGSRLGARTDELPKTLLPFGQGTILSQILHNFSSIGIEEFVIVVGYQAVRLTDYLAEHGSFGLRVEVVENLEWRRGNGVSVLRARDQVGSGAFLLSMSDHLVSPAALAALRDAPSSNNLLLVDPRLDAVVDLEDATKVEMQGDRITRIGKDLERYDGFDCGVFRLTHGFFDAMTAELAQNRESISEGARRLIREQAFEGVLLPPGCDWIDVDTPETYAFALQHQSRFT
jgi:choline kinase